MEYIIAIGGFVILFGGGVWFFNWQQSKKRKEQSDKCGK